MNGRPLTHNPFAALKGRQVAEVIRLPVRDVEIDGKPVEGAPAILIALPFGVVRRSERMKAQNAAKLKASARTRDIREVYESEVRRHTGCRVLVP